MLDIFVKIVITVDIMEKWNEVRPKVEGLIVRLKHAAKNYNNLA